MHSMPWKFTDCIVWAKTEAPCAFQKSFFDIPKLDFASSAVWFFENRQNSLSPHGPRNRLIFLKNLERSELDAPRSAAEHLHPESAKRTPPLKFDWKCRIHHAVRVHSQLAVWILEYYWCAALAVSFPGAVRFTVYPPKDWRFRTHNLKVPSFGESLKIPVCGHCVI